MAQAAPAEPAKAQAPLDKAAMAQAPPVKPAKTQAGSSAQYIMPQLGHRGYVEQAKATPEQQKWMLSAMLAKMSVLNAVRKLEVKKEVETEKPAPSPAEPAQPHTAPAGTMIAQLDDPTAQTRKISNKKLMLQKMSDTRERWDAKIEKEKVRVPTHDDWDAEEDCLPTPSWKPMGAHVGSYCLALSRLHPPRLACPLVGRQVVYKHWHIYIYICGIYIYIYSGDYLVYMYRSICTCI